MLRRIEERIKSEEGLESRYDLMADRNYLLQYAKDLEQQILILQLLLKLHTGAML